MEPGYGGFADLGSILSGGAVDQQAAFTKGATGRATLESAMANARINRDKAMQREKTKEALIGMGVPPEKADGLEILMRSGQAGEFSSGMTGMDTQMRSGFRNEAVGAGRGGDLDLMNVLLAGAQGTPMTTTQVDEGYVMNPHGSPDQKIGTTDGKLADIMANTALADQRKAATGLTNARTENVKDRTANPDKYKPAPKPSKNSDNVDAAPPAAAIKQLKKGARTKFANGQTWTLDAEGKPARID